MNIRRLIFPFLLFPLFLIHPTANAQSVQANGYSRVGNDRHLAVIVLMKPDLAVLTEIRSQIAKSGGSTFHVFPPYACIAELAGSQFGAFRRDSRISIVADSAVAAGAGSPEVALAIGAWNNLLRHREEMARGFAADPSGQLRALSPDAGRVERALSQATSGIQKSDALIPPPSAFRSLPKGARQTFSGMPHGADFFDTSEYFIGDIVVGVLILESTDHLYVWSDAQLSQTIGGIVAGMDWWATCDPRSNRTFTYDIHVKVPISTEPIYGSIGDDVVWGEEALAKLGYSTGDVWFDARSYLNDIRAAYHTNWAIMMFVINNDPAVNQGLFRRGGGYAHAYFGGPWLTMARYSSWAYNAQHYYTAVPAHETGHLFYATDEYDGYPLSSGYFNAGDHDFVDCIMNQNSLNGACDSSRLQIGWRYTGGNTPDVLNVPPQILLNPYLPDPTSVPDPTYTGVATAGALANLNPFGQRHAITLNSVAAVEYAPDSTPWTPISASDPFWDSAGGNFSFTPSPLLDGSYTFSARATDNLGHVSLASDLLTINTGGKLTSVDTLDFGAVYVANLDTMTLRILNNKSDTAHIGGATLSNAFYFTLLDNATFSIPGNSSKDLRISFLTVSPGVENGKIDFFVLDGGGSTLTVQLTGYGVSRPKIQISPESVMVTLNHGDSLSSVCTVFAGLSDTLKFSVAAAYPPSTSARLLLVDLGERTSLLLDSLKLPYTLISDAQFDTVALSRYRGIVVGSSAYAISLLHLYNRRDEVRQFIENGGGIVALTERAWNAWKWLPDTVLGTIVEGNLVHVTDSTHPVMSSLTDDGLSNQYASYLNVFSKLPAGYDVIASTDGGAHDPLVAASEYGAGRIVLTGLHLERFRGGGYPQALQLLGNMIHWSMQDGAGWLSVLPGEGTIAGGANMSCFLSVRWNLLGAGQYRSELHFSSNDPVRPDYVVPVTLNVIGLPRLTTSVDTLNFGTTFIGYSDTLAVTISNSGLDTLRVSHMNTNSTRFVLFDTSGFVLAPRRFRDIDVRYVPGTPGTEGGALSIFSNDPLALTKQILLTGEAAYTLLFGVDPGWNLLSVPYRASDERAKILYPSASSPAFSFAGSYVIEDTLSAGHGYWLKFPTGTTTTIPLDGEAMSAETIVVAPRWNLVGAISTPVRTADIITQPPALLASPYYGYSSANGYDPVDLLVPGKGYWIRTNGVGKIVLQYAPSPAPRIVSSPVDHPGVYRLIVSDALNRSKTLLLGGRESLPSAASAYELPPLPPEGGFDVRYRSGLWAEVYTLHSEREERFTIDISNASYPITIRCDAGGFNDGAFVGVATAAGSGEKYYSLNEGAKIALDTPPAAGIVLVVNSQQERPSAFSLYQNFPNPFNATTEIRYTLRDAGTVTLKIYDVLGREIETLVNEFQSPGYKSVSFDGTLLPSGVYFYKISAGTFVGQKKLLLMK